MAIQDTINALKGFITNAYTTIGNKGGTIPSSKNTQNLANVILSIPEPASGLYMHNILLYMVGHAQDGNMFIVSTNKNAMTKSEIAGWLYSKGFTSKTKTYPAFGSGTQKDIYEFASSSTSTKTKYTISPYMPSGIFSANGTTTLTAKVLQSGTQDVISVVDNVIKIS